MQANPQVPSVLLEIVRAQIPNVLPADLEAVMVYVARVLSPATLEDLIRECQNILLGPPPAPAC